MKKIYRNKEQCCGCCGCANICRKNAITMTPDERGFLYPVIDQERCTDCGLCQDKCVFQKRYDIGGQAAIPDAYAAIHINPKVRAQSRSGGIFTALTDELLEQSGVIYGCVLKGNFLAYHTRALTKQERDDFRGSKYIQSDMNDIYRKIENDLLSGKKVLFSGTPCQVAQVREYCKNFNTENLYLVDILCHGVPSPLIWTDYLKYIKQKEHNKKIESIDFRNKEKFGWKAHFETIQIAGKPIHSGLFRKLFFGHWILRQSCFECAYKSLTRVGDISIGDCWGIEKTDSKFNDDKGVSLVLLNNGKGRKFFFGSIVNESIEYENISANDPVFYQKALGDNFCKPKDMDLFWYQYLKKGIKYVLKKYAKDSLLKKVKKKLKKLWQSKI